MSVAEQLAFDWPPAEIVPHPLARLPEVTAAHGALHAKLIADVVRREDAWTIQFRKQVAKFLPTLAGFSPGDEDDIVIPHVVPDAYRLDPLDRKDDDGHTWGKITVWEVEVRNEMPAEKIDLYAWWWFDLDATDWLVDFELIAVDKHGVHRPVDLCSHVYANWTRIYGSAA